MNSHRISVLLALLLLTASSGPLGAQRRAELALPDGRVVEVLGLHRWTLAMLQDSLARYAPGDSLHKHSCAATLRNKLGFADAAVTTYTLRRDQPARVVVSLREPQDSTKVRYRKVPMDTAPGYRGWQPVTGIMRTHPAAFWAAANAYAAGEEAPGGIRTAEDSAATSSVLAFLRSRTTERDRRAALVALRESPNRYDRAVAALILRHFPERDDTWHALVETLLESDGWPKSAASAVLQQLGYRHARTIDWTPVAGSIHAILDGTSLFQVPTVIDVLTRTGVGPAQASGFLRGGGSMLIEYLGSGTSMLSYPAHQLLVLLRGSDLGAASEPWEAWIGSL